MTLIELLVALTLLGFIAATLAGSLRVGGRALAATDDLTESMDQVVFSQMFLRRQLSQVVVGLSPGDSAFSSSANEGGGSRLAGGESSLSFTAPWLSDVGQGALFAFNLSKVGRDLVLDWRPARADPSQSGSREASGLAGQRTLVTGVENVRIRYFGQPNDRRPIAWQSAWRERTRLPQLLSIEIALDGGRSGWPPFVIMLAS